MPDLDPASPAFTKVRRFRFAFKKWAHRARDDAFCEQIQCFYTELLSYSAT